jgi:hypothetical protein
MANSEAGQRSEALSHYESVWLKCRRLVQKQELEPAMQTLLATLDSSDRPRNVIVLLDADSDESTSETLAEALRVAQQHPRLAELLFCGPDRILEALSQMLAREIRCFNESGALFAYLGQRSA